VVGAVDQRHLDVHDRERRALDLHDGARSRDLEAALAVWTLLRIDFRMARLPLNPFIGLAMRNKVSNRDIGEVRLSVDDTQPPS